MLRHRLASCAEGDEDFGRSYGHQQILQNVNRIHRSNFKKMIESMSILLKMKDFRHFVPSTDGLPLGFRVGNFVSGHF